MNSSTKFYMYKTTKLFIRDVNEYCTQNQKLGHKYGE